MTALSQPPAIEPAAQQQDRALYRKVALRIVPFLFISYIVAFLDRINIGFAQLQMKGDLGFSDAVYGLGAGVFFLGYFLFEVPSNLLLQRIGARRTFIRIMVCWGLISAGMAFVTTPLMLYLMRFLLGVFEAGFFPGIILYLTYWFPASRRAAVTSWLFVAVAIAGVLGGIVSGAIMEYTGGMLGLSGWQWMFIIEGLPAAVLGVMAWWLLQDHPSSARWLSAAEKARLQAHLDADQAARSHVASHSFADALRNPRVYLLAAVYFTLTCGTMAISFWLPAMIKSAGVNGVLQVGLYSAIPYGFGALGIVLVSRHSDRHRERRGHYAVCAILGGVTLSALGFLPASLPLMLVLLSMAVVFTFAALPVFWSIPQDYLSGTGAAGGIALISSLGQLGSFFSPTLIGWVKMVTGRIDNGLHLLALLLVLGGVTLYFALGSRREVEAGLVRHHV
ncbi:MFS transporter [Paraburkholderia bonniea]|uniref:MFS transporter n=1 Tax=Paraburkholderia bonniea TaxID=2152891 RepID=UPI00129283C6|nr:MFS transporter [Paraburkholderia bonniea]WJF92108.1 MFS transporter [Paraburkholderia bonniea]WJF95428.1 MFS transporter [Paraburkholderia bonniea]